MSDKTAIEWADASWNPIRSTTRRHYCERISPGCDHCYASTMTKRLAGHDYPRVADPGEPGQKVDGVRPTLDEAALKEPLRWRAPRRVFVCSMTDLFGEWVTDQWLNRIFSVFLDAPQHTYLVLTKRPRRMLDYLRSIAFMWPDQTLADAFPNVWFGVSVESNAFVWRAKLLADLPVAVRFVSAEPLLGPLPSLDMTGIDWLIVGGESGHSARPVHGAWVRDLRDRATSAGVALHFKQWGGRTHDAGGRLLDGRTWDEFPASVGVL